MALPSVGGGSQLGDGNVNEETMAFMAPVQTATSTATLTATQITGKILVGDPSTSAASYTLPTVVLLEALLTNAHIGSTFDLTVINLGTSSGVITVLVGTGWTIVGKATVPITTTDGSSVTFRALKTGSGAWTLYNVG